MCRKTAAGRLAPIGANDARRQPRDVDRSRDSNHLIIGNDGGSYFSLDRGKAWNFVANLPVGQFYAIAVDMGEPFYYVYGGTQDNRSCGGPCRDAQSDGIANADWYQTLAATAFIPAVGSILDMSTPVAGGGRRALTTRSTGERRAIAPEPPEGTSYRWNWSAPLLISPHDHQTLYFAANVVFKSFRIAAIPGRR